MAVNGPGCGGITPSARTIAVLISPAMPAAAMVCPMFAFTAESQQTSAPGWSGSDGGEHVAKRGHLDLVADSCCRAVCLDETDCRRVHLSVLVGPAQRQNLTVYLGRHGPGRSPVVASA